MLREVINEALAARLPIVTTPTACDEGIVIHGENGFRVEVRGMSQSLSGKNATARRDVGPTAVCQRKRPPPRRLLVRRSEYGRRAAEDVLECFSKHAERSRWARQRLKRRLNRQGGPGGR